MEHQMEYGHDYKYIPATSIQSGKGIEVLPDVYNYTIKIVNIQLIGNKDGFVLIDAGMTGSAKEIISVVEDRFGKQSRPQAIILTHGHFDHVGALIELIDYWKIPVYAHKLELPFLTGKQSYPEPDPTVEGGLVAKLSAFFPNEPIDVGGNIEALPDDGKVPFLEGFKWVHTPGHTPGHISLYRSSDRLLIAGDAFVTVKQEYLYKVFMQEQEISGPPKYFTPDWDAAKLSVKKLASIKPSIAVTGHGLPMTGDLLTNSLDYLVKNFDDIGKPDYGKYVH